MAELTAWVVSWAASPYGAAALFLLAFAESSFFPIPPDALLIPLCLLNPPLAFIYALICAAGSVLGGMAGYVLGLLAGRPILKRLFKAERIRLVEAYYKKWDVWAVGLAGFTPIPYKIFTISAGVFDLNFPRFVMVSIVSRSARFFMVGALLFFFGQAMQAFVQRYFSVLTIVFVALLIGGFWLVGFLGRRAAKAGENS